MASLPVRYLTNIFCRRRNRATVAVSCLIIVGVIATSSLKVWSDLNPEDERDWEAEFERAHLESLREHMSFYITGGAKLRPVPPQWTARDRCPACYGTDMCDAVDRQELFVEVPDQPSQANRKGVYLGRWKDIPIVVKMLTNGYPPEFRNFDDFVCLKATGKRHCNVSAAITSDYIMEDKDLLSPDHLLSAWKISYNQSGPLALTYALCLTEEIVTSFSRLYSADGSAHLSRPQRAMLFTSMVVQPESLMLKFLKTAEFDLLAPRVYGACGRLVVVEHSGRPLQTYINASFFERAELTLQLISLMKQLWHADQNWFALFTDIQYENIAVTHYNQVYLIDHEHLSIIPSVRSPWQQPQQQPGVDRPRRDNGWKHQDEGDLHDNLHERDEAFVCNTECFNELLTRLSLPDLSSNLRAAECRVLHDFSLSFMYSALCSNILVDSASHRGLLHGVPDDEELPDFSQQISEALAECVHESRAGGRVGAIEQMFESLSVYTGVRLE